MKMSHLSAGSIAIFLVSGCAFFHHGEKGSEPSASAPAPIVTPDKSLTATVISYNATGRFVVLGFPVGQLPRIDQTLFLYRNGLKVGEVRVTGPQQDNNIVADLMEGEARAGDEVRDQ